ncbi:tyrosine-type recombinase/integrase [Hymenobacter siberiensis]|uniref:tyrosine-type recombinase/integrase n=1 Tax=Hymenobacter siberiensis TaxID=2848396 RepID=UPI001C1DEA9D|nr:tyrosine-type recombinase/integrase [Hymenobacter siberiensis]
MSYHYKLDGKSLKTGKATIYIVYRSNGTEVAKSMGVTVNPKHFNSTTGRVSSKDAQFIEKNERIQQRTDEFQAAIRDVEMFGQPVTKATIDAIIQSDNDWKQQRESELVGVHAKGWQEVSENEARLAELREEMKQTRWLVWRDKYILEEALPREERYQRMIHDLQQQLAALDAEAAEIRDQITHIQEEAGFVSSALFVDKLNEYCKIKLLNMSMQKQTVSNYKLIATAVNKFNPRLQLKDMDLQFFQDFQAHLVDRGVTNNSIRGMMTRIKGIYLYFADDLNLPTGFFSKFEQVKARKDENILFLTPEELAELESLPLKPRVHQEVRQQFLFAVETGLRRSDYNITAANIKGREIVVTTQKTGKTVSIPATDKALQLFNEAGQNFRLIPESQFNQTLRLICQKMKTMQSESLKTLQVGSKVTTKSFKKWQRMTSHVARKTFVENAVAKGIELIAIAEWLGHSDTTMLTKHYANTKMIAKREAHKLFE